MKITRKQIRQIVKEELSRRINEINEPGSLRGFSPELGLEGTNDPEIAAHLRSIQASQTGQDYAGERAAILAYLEWLSDKFYDEARQSGAPEGGDMGMFDTAMELDAYVHQASADSSFDELGWIDNISQLAAENNPDIGGVVSDQQDYDMGFMSENQKE